MSGGVHGKWPRQDAMENSTKRRVGGPVDSWVSVGAVGLGGLPGWPWETVSGALLANTSLAACSRRRGASRRRRDPAS